MPLLNITKSIDASEMNIKAPKFEFISQSIKTKQELFFERAFVASTEN